jgi:osmotically-inducible protein OsmY
MPAYQEPVMPPAPAAVPMARPLGQMQIETAPIPTAAIPSIGRTVQDKLLEDRTLSRSAQLSLNVTSKGKRVTLRGIVISQEEKTYIGQAAEAIAGPGNIDNRMTVL